MGTRSADELGIQLAAAGRSDSSSNSQRCLGMGPDHSGGWWCRESLCVTAIEAGLLSCRGGMGAVVIGRDGVGHAAGHRLQQMEQAFVGC